jgi:uncharacterized protein YbaR (Trm112 family)/ubiquinone/menaquinone biosynthesis C-methylase UbiE
MKQFLVSMLQCPLCKSELSLSTEEIDGSEIIKGVLVCTKCSNSFPISDGVPNLVPPEQRESHVARSFGFEWQEHHLGGFENKTVFGRTLDKQIKYFFEGLGISDTDINGKWILDGGCGSGVLSMEIARCYPKSEIIAMDITPAIKEVFRKGKQLPNLHVVQGNVLEPPFPVESFDFLWSNGVIHHTGDTQRAFESLTALVKNGGRAYLWVYEKKLSVMVALRKLLRPFGLVHWNNRFLYRFCQVISFPTWLVVTFLSIFHKFSFIQKHTHLKIITRRRGFHELVLTWFDVLSPMYRDTYTQQEFESWFEKRGFYNLARYWWPVGVSGTKGDSV